MTAKDYILSRLKELKTPAVLTRNPGETDKDFVVRALLSKHFRKYAVTPEYKDQIINSVEASFAKNEPIKPVFVFGGYKLWRLDEAPRADWAELFSLIYFTNWLKPILAVYKPGVWFDFYSDDVILEPMDNVSKKETGDYITSFRQLLEFIKPFLPQNLSFTLNRVGDQYKSEADFKKELEESVDKTKKELHGLPKLSSEQIALVDLNVRLKPGQKNDPQWREKVFLIHEGYTKVSKRRPYYRTSEKIMVVNVPIKDSLAIGTTKKSVVKFWVGAGVLEKQESGFIENILSPHQLADGKFTREKISIPGLPDKNFKTIKVS